MVVHISQVNGFKRAVLPDTNSKGLNTNRKEERAKGAALARPTM